MDRASTLLFQTIAVWLTVCVAEGLSRRAFANHPQLWKTGTPGVVSSDGILGRTLGGYLLSTLGLFYVVSFYLVATQLWGWWSPLTSLADPNILAMRLPWAGPLANSLQAGVFEECLFRALPLSAALLLGRKVGHEKLCVGVVLVFQALIFSAAHANYESFPAYCRLVELTLPSLVAGILFLRWGLIPVILMHFLYDAVLMNLPLFVMRFEGAWVHQATALAAMATPLAVVVAARARASANEPLPQSALNGSWSADPPSERKAAPAPRPLPPQKVLPEKVQGGFAAVCAVLLVCLVAFKSRDPHLSVDRSGAIKLAREFLSRNGIELDGEWTARAQALNDSPSQEERLLLRDNAAAIARSVEEYLPRLHWSVDFCRFSGDVAERTHRYLVTISGEGEHLSLTHFLPESSAGASLHEACAREIALDHLEKEVGFPVHVLEEVSSHAEKMPSRTDWIFVFHDTRHALAGGAQARVAVRIAGEHPVQTSSFIHFPEQTLVEQTKRVASAQKLVSLVDALGTFLVMVCFVHAAICSARGQWNARLFRGLILVLAPLTLLKGLNGWPGAEAGFNTLKPLEHQRFDFFSSCLSESILTVGISCMLAGMTFHTPNLSPLSVRRIVGGAFTMALVTRVYALFLNHLSGEPWVSTGIFFAGHSWIVSLHGLSLFTQITSSLGLLAYIGLILNRISSSSRLGWLGEPLFIFGILLYFLSSTPSATQSTSQYLLTAALHTLPVSLGFRFLMGRSPEGVPLLTCGLCVISNFEDLLHPIFPGQQACSLVAIASACVFSVAWVYWIARQKDQSAGFVPPAPQSPTTPRLYSETS